MIARKPFAEGGMRWCYKMYEIDKNGKHAPGVAKTFKDDAIEEGEGDEEIAKAYFDEAMTQTVADSFAQQWNQVLGEEPEHAKLKCRFLPVRVMQFYGKSGPRALCNCEPYLQGDYVKHNDNDGHVETTLEVPQAFSHFTWEYSNGLILVCDIQGLCLHGLPLVLALRRPRVRAGMCNTAIDRVARPLPGVETTLQTRRSTATTVQALAWATSGRREWKSSCRPTSATPSAG